MHIFRKVRVLKYIKFLHTHTPLSPIFSLPYPYLLKNLKPLPLKNFPIPCPLANFIFVCFLSYPRCTPFKISHNLFFPISIYFLLYIIYKGKTCGFPIREPVSKLTGFRKRHSSLAKFSKIREIDFS